MVTLGGRLEMGCPCSVVLPSRTHHNVALLTETAFPSQIVRVGGIDIGYLLSKDDEEDQASTVATTFWVVSVEGDSHEEEVISEKALGRVLDADESDDSGKSATIAKVKKVTKKATNAKIKAKSSKKGTRRMNTRATSKDGALALLNEGKEIQRRLPPPRPKKKQGDERVIEVKMLTGTLFIYRGMNHRVEFVRTV